jgi:hypothetical protein
MYLVLHFKIEHKAELPEKKPMNISRSFLKWQK